jgi:hypothetical protein
MKGWLDNFGKADNANDSNVSLPEGFVGLGYNTKGRKFSPAWGGQFAMGGSIPGSVGFTYARTAGSAPSKGKYAKKTMASAQNGIMSPLLLGRKILEYIYPSEEAANTVEAAPANYKKGLTNELLQRQAYKESTFNPAAVSPAGYKGLTQIGEGVLEDYSKKKGGKKLDPFNPKDAVELQKFAMNDLYNASFINKPEQSDSVRIAKTLAAYNWGRGNLANYLNEQKDKGVDIYDSYDWLNNLPKETSDYVNKILLQEDPSFNKNYKKASTNPKYEEVTSLYDQKKFGGKIPSAQKGKNDIEKISINDPRYPEMYKNRQVGLSYDGTISLPDLDEVTVTAPRSYTIDSLRDFTTAALYGTPANTMKLSMIPQAAMTEAIEALRGEPYDFSNVNPNFGGFTSNQRDLSQTMGYENPEGFAQNFVNFGLSAIDPTLIAGGASMIKKPLQKKLAKSFSKNFKSQIDWAKWNKEIPENKALMQEYNTIEQQAKSNGTWMKNSDGSKFKGTPEQFVQENSKNFKDSNLNSNKTYRVNTRRSDNNPIIHDESSNIAFTGDEKSARPYMLGNRNSSYLSAIDPPSTLGLHELYATGNKRLTIDAKNASYDNVFYNGKNNKTYRIAEESFLNPEINNVNILNVKNHLEGPMSLVEKIIGRKYGNELINKQVPGNYLKSARGNNGMFDMTNPNIYKALVPSTIAAGAIPQKQNGGEMRFYQNGLDWKPKSMQGGGEQPLRVSTSDPRYPELYKNRQVGAYYDGAYSLPDLPEVVVTGKDESLKEAMSQGSGKFLQGLAGVIGAPQAVTMELLTGKQQTPSEAFGFQQPGGWLDSYSSFGKNLGNFAMDAVLDPVNLLGVGLVDDVARASARVIANKPIQQFGRAVGSSDKVVFDLMDESIDPFGEVLKNVKIDNTPSSFAEDVQREALDYQQLTRDPRYLERVRRIDRDFGSNMESLLNSFNRSETADGKFFPFNISVVDEIPAGDQYTFDSSMGVSGLTDAGFKKFSQPGWKMPWPFNRSHRNALPIDPATDRYVQIAEKAHLVGNQPARGTVQHELKHHWTNALLDANNQNYGQGLKSFIAPRRSVVADPRDQIANKNYNYLSGSTEVDAFLMTEMRDEMVKRGYLKDHFDELTENKLNEFLTKEKDYRGAGEYFNPSKPMVADKSKFVDFFNKYGLPSTVIGGVLGEQAIDQQKNGGITKDNQGYWNPDNWGKPVEIDSNNITMEGVYEPLLGVSDTGDTKLMKPGKNYKFKGKKVTEYPVAQIGKNIPFKGAANSNPKNPANPVREDFSPSFKEEVDFPIDYNKDEVTMQKNWLNSYIKSPKYTERLKKEFPGKTNEFIKNEVAARLNNLSNAKLNYVNSIGKSPGWIAGAYAPKKAQGETYDYSKKKWIPTPPASGKFKPGNVYLESEYKADNFFPSRGFETIPLHEFGHAVDDGGSRIPDSTIRKIYNYTKDQYDYPSYKKGEMEFSYENTPSEFVNRIQPIRYLLNRANIYDAKSSDFTEEHYDRMMENMDIFQNVHYKDVMRRLGNDDDIKKKAFIDLMNTIAYKNDSTEIPVAELGINQLDAQPMKKLNQLLNFTNNPDKDNWLDKYN